MTAITHWPRGTSLTGQNQETAVYSAGVKKQPHPILAIHGMWGTNKRWENYGQFFSEAGFEFIAPTLRYHYKENKVPELGRTSVNDYVADVKALSERLIEERGLRPIVFGHSMGGLIAQKVAEAGLAEKLVLLNSAPPAGIKLHADISYQIAIARYLPWILLQKPFKPSFAIYARYIMNGMPKDQHEELYKNAVCESGRAAKEIRFGKIAVDFSKIKCPTVVVGCAKDRIVPSQVAFDIAQKMDKRDVSFRLWFYPQFAHWIQTEPGWEKPAQDIFNWITK